MTDAGQQRVASKQEVEDDLAAEVHAARRRLAAADEASRARAMAELANALARLSEMLFRREGQ